jgi:hypothetical protein
MLFDKPARAPLTPSRNMSAIHLASRADRRL